MKSDPQRRKIGKLHFIIYWYFGAIEESSQTGLRKLF